MSTPENPFASPEPGAASSPQPPAAPPPGYGQPYGQPYGPPPPAQQYGQPSPPPGEHGQSYGPPPFPQQYGGPAYGQPPYGWSPYGVPPGAGRTNGMAIASMVLGILWLYWIGSILALVFGYIAKKQIRERGESGGGMATAGIVLGWIGVGVLALVVVLGIIGYAASESSY